MTVFLWFFFKDVGVRVYLEVEVLVVVGSLWVVGSVLV